MITRQLITRYRQGLCSPAELDLIQAYLSGGNLSELKRMLDEDWENAGNESGQEALDEEVRIWDRLVDDMSQNVRLGERVTRRFNLRLLWQCAASACILVMCGWWISEHLNSKDDVYELNRREAKTFLIEKINESVQPILITLDDGSQVRLSTQSKISYASAFGSGRKREVFLSGEAFFIVVPHSDKPFYVYADELVTKVLGTSFHIRAYAEDQNVTVKVHSGQVRVNVADKLKNKARKVEDKGGVLLTTNQQAVLLRRAFHLVKTLVDQPELITPVAKADTRKQNDMFKFQEATINEVFDAIKKGYGVNIVYDDVILAQCQLSADLSGESLYEKLDIICKSIGADYQIVDAQIIITGKGCDF
jgi:transmembrane sensor